MRQQFIQLSTGVGLLVISACSTGTTGVNVPEAPGHTAAMPVVAEPASRPIVTVSRASFEDEGSAQRATPLPGAPVAPEGEVAVAPDLDVFSSSTRPLNADTRVSSVLDPWRPEFVGVINRTGTSLTLAWHTTAKTRGAVYFGRTLFMRWNGFNQARYVSESRNNHTLTIQGLDRFASYTFAVVGMDPILQTQFPAPPLRARTALF